MFLSGESKEKLLMIEMVLFLRLNCVSISNFNVLDLTLLIRSITIFSLLYEGIEKLSPSCSRH